MHVLENPSLTVGVLPGTVQLCTGSSSPAEAWKAVPVPQTPVQGPFPTPRFRWNRGKASRKRFGDLWQTQTGAWVPSEAKGTWG